MITKLYENTMVLCTKHSHPAFTNAQNIEQFASFIMLPFQYRQLAAELNSNGIKESNINMPILSVGTDMTHLEERSLLCSLVTNTVSAFKVLFVNSDRVNLDSTSAPPPPHR